VAIKRDGTIYVVSEGKLLAIASDKKVTTFIGADQLDERNGGDGLARGQPLRDGTAGSLATNRGSFGSGS